MRKLLAFAICGLLGIAPASAQQASGCDDISGPIHFGVGWQDEIKPIFNELISPTGRCTSCHNSGSPAGGLDLTDADGFDAIYKIVNGVHVVPGRPNESLLFLKVNCAEPPSGSRMPFGNPLTRMEQELIHDWIAQGAQGGLEEDPPNRGFGYVFSDGLEGIR